MEIAAGGILDSAIKEDDPGKWAHRAATSTGDKSRLI
jgi:hypothetical protein